MKGISLCALSIVFLCISSVVNSQTTYNGFEGNTVGSWYLLPGAVTTLEVANGGASNTAKSLKLTGGQGLIREGAALNITTLSPSSLSFWVKVDTVANLGGVMLGSGTEANQVAIEFRFRSNGEMVVVGGTAGNYFGATPYAVDTWYNIRIDITFATSKYNFFVDGASRATGVDFRNTVTSFNTMLLVNSQNSPTAASYIDEIYIGCPNNCGGRTCNTTSGACTCGVQSCGIDCAISATPLTMSTPFNGTLATGAQNFYFDPQGVAFDIVLTSNSATAMYWRVPSTQCVAATAGSFTDSTSTSFVQNQQVGTFNITSCTVFQNGAGPYSILVSNNLAQTATFSLTVVPGISTLSNAKAVTRKISNSMSGVYSIKVPTTTSPTTLQYSFVVPGLGPTATFFSIFARPNSCPTNANPAPNDVNATRSVNGYSSGLIPVTGGTTYYFLLTCIMSYQYDVTFTASLSNCDTYCSGNGVCFEGQCVCHNGWRGSICDARRCPNDCFGRGSCSNEGVCTCDAGYAGSDCGCSAVPLTIGSTTTTLLSANTFTYYSIDLTNSKSGVTFTSNVSLSNNNYDIYWGVGVCTTDTTVQNTETYTWKVKNSLQLSDCLINQWGTKWVIGLRSSILRGVSFDVNRTEYVSLENNKALVSVPVNGYLVYDVPSTSSVTVYLSQYATSGASIIYISNSSCPSGTNNFFNAPLTTEFQRTFSDVPAGRLWIWPNTAYNPRMRIVNTNCDLFCSGNGVCLDNKCACNPEYMGSDCSLKRCPSDCNNRGTCTNGVCSCDINYGGEDCSCYAPRLTLGQSVTVNVTYQLAYYSIDLTEYPDGVDVFVSSQVSLYWGTQCAPSTSTSQWLITGTPARTSITNCNLATYANKKWIVGAYTNTAGYALTLRARTVAPLENLVKYPVLVADSKLTEFYYDVPAGVTSVTVNVTLQNYVSSYLYITQNNTCYTPTYVGRSNVYEYSFGSYQVSVTAPTTPGRYYVVYTGSYSYTVRVSMGNCSSTCNGAGTCVSDACFCNSNYAGANCQTVLSCTSNCNYNGDCVAGNICQCYQGFFGSSCACRDSGTLSSSNTTITTTLTSTVSAIAVNADDMDAYEILITNPGSTLIYSVSTSACGTASTYAYSTDVLISSACNSVSTKGTFYINIRTQSGTATFTVSLRQVADIPKLSATVTTTAVNLTTASGVVQIDTSQLAGYELTINPPLSNDFYYSLSTVACGSAGSYGTGVTTLSGGCTSVTSGTYYLQLRSTVGTAVITVTLRPIERPVTLSPTNPSATIYVPTSAVALRVDTSSVTTYDITFRSNSGNTFYYGTSSSNCGSANSAVSGTGVISRTACETSGLGGVFNLMLRTYSVSEYINVTFNSASGDSQILSVSNTFISQYVTTTTSSIRLDTTSLTGYELTITPPDSFNFYYSISSSTCSNPNIYAFGTTIVSRGLCDYATGTSSYIGLRMSSSIQQGYVNVTLRPTELVTLSASVTTATPYVTTSATQISIDTTQLSSYELTITPKTSTTYQYSSSAMSCNTDFLTSGISGPVSISKGLCSASEMGISYIVLKVSSGFASSFFDVSLTPSASLALRNNVPVSASGMSDRYWTYENTKKTGFFIYVYPTSCSNFGTLYLKYDGCPSIYNYTVMLERQRCREASSGLPAVAALTVAPAYTGTYYILYSPYYSTYTNATIVIVPVNDNMVNGATTFSPVAVLFSLIVSAVIFVIM